MDLIHSLKIEENFNLAVLAWMVIAILIIPLEMMVTAPYGRHTSKSWGPLIPNRLGWFIMEIPSLAIFSYYFLSGPFSAVSVPVFLFGCFAIHYINRAFIFPFRIRTKGKMMPITIMLFAIFFNFFNGFFLGHYFHYFADQYGPDWWFQANFIIGLILFVAGFVINQYADHKLINLRKPGETGYKIPKGGLFEYISCPNHFAETVEWIGFALMAWNLPALGFAVWTFANLMPRALSHHKWYKEKFADYPEQRKAFIPFIL